MESQPIEEDGGFPPVSMRPPYADRAIVSPEPPMPEVAALTVAASKGRARKLVEDVSILFIVLVVVVLAALGIKYWMKKR